MGRIWYGRADKADQEAPLHALLRFAALHHLTVTSGEHIDAQGKAHFPHSAHNTGSLHYAGRAIDVSTHGLSTPEVEHLAELAQAVGINTYDEREPPRVGAWTGPHLHLSISPPGTYEI